MLQHAGEPDTPSGVEVLQAILRDLSASLRDITGSVVVSRDGLTMASIGGGVDADRMGALCTEVFGLGQSTANELQHGDLQEILLKSDGGYALVTRAGPEAMLAVMARPDANLGLVLLEARRAANAIASTF